MPMLCDLHLHSTFSDGTDTPTRLVELAQELGLGAIALTDHNTVAGVPEFLEAAKGKPVRAIAGTEFSTDWEGLEVHILGLFLKPEHFPVITARLAEYHRQKDQSNRDLVENLKQAGYVLDYDRLKAKTPKGQVNRALIADEMTKLGYAQSVKDAFSRFLKPKCGYYTPPRRPDPFETIRYIKSLGAAAVLAHPFLTFRGEEELRVFLKQAAQSGLDAMETRYSTYDEETTARAEKMADDFGLLHSGGSDYHGKIKPHIQMGSGQGNLTVPYGHMVILEERL